MSGNFYHFAQEEKDLELVPTYQTAHIDTMPYLWTVVIDLSVILVIYKFRAFSSYFHAIIGLFVGLTTLISSFPILIDKGIPSKENEIYMQRHFIIGLICLIIILIQLLLGLLTKTLQLISRSHPYHIYFINTCHKYLGYSLLILCKIQVFLR